MLYIQQNDENAYEYDKAEKVSNFKGNNYESRPPKSGISQIMMKNLEKKNDLANSKAVLKPYNV